MRVGLVFDNSVKCIELIIKIWNDGDCVVFPDWRIPKHKIVEMLTRCDVEKCYIASSIFAKWDLCEPCNINFIPIDDSEEKSGMVPEKIMNQYHTDYSEKEALILFSSGTTGNAKGIVLSRKAIEKNADAIINYMQLKEDDVFYILKTLAHSSTIVGELLVALKSKCGIVISPSVYAPPLVLRNISKYQVTITCMNPTLLWIYSKLVNKSKENIDSLKTIYVSGAILSNELMESAKRAFKNVEIFNVYGLTEAGPRVSAQYKGEKWQSGSVGKAIKGVKIAVVDKDGEPVKNGERGIVHVKTDYLFSGYSSGEKLRESYYQGWFNTGDVGYKLEDELFITGRWDNMIIHGAHNVFPEDIEKTINEVKGIDECVVFGVNDEIDGEMIICYYSSDNDIENDIRTYCKDKLATYEVPKKICKVERIPKTENGKISRRLARESYMKRGSNN